MINSIWNSKDTLALASLVFALLTFIVMSSIYDDMDFVSQRLFFGAVGGVLSGVRKMS
jgi:hypothetical protein